MRGAAPHAQKKERVYQNAIFLGVETWRAASRCSQQHIKHSISIIYPME